MSKLDRPNARRSHRNVFAALAAGAAVVIGVAALLIVTLSGGTVKPLIAVTAPPAPGFDDHENRLTVQRQNPVADSFVEAVNAFSVKTAAPLLAEGSGNQNYSPLSLYYALALAATGAEGDTARQFYDLLGVADSEILSTQCGNLYRRLYTDNEIGRLKIANSLWMSKDIPFQAAFVQNAANQFYASAFSVDFAAPATGKAMGQWVADNTGGLLTPDFTPDPEQMLSILNTVYFRDQWQSAFDKDCTHDDHFHTEDGQDVSTAFMNRSGTTSFAKGDAFTRAELSLKNGGEMVFVLPDKGVSPRELLKTPEKARDVLFGENDRYGKVTWKIPKFRFSASFDLAEPLQQMGLTEVFTKEADFSGLSDQPSYIRDVRQETRIGIDEQGVEAAAFTALELDATAAPLPEDRAEMILDRPFLYFIRSREGVLLFAGIGDDPPRGIG